MPTADHGPYMVTAKDVKNGIINYSTARKTTQKAFDSLLTDKSRPQKGDVLVTKDGTLGRLAVVEDANLCINQSVALLRPNNKIDSHYLKNLLSSKYYQDLMIAQAGGATIKHIYITRVDKMLVPTPSIDVQKEIVKKIDIVSSKVKRLEASYQQKIRRLDELKKSILEKAFSGQLTASTKTLIHE
jgi:type I restriction enzyme S subunit